MTRARQGAVAILAALALAGCSGSSSSGHASQRSTVPPNRLGDGRYPMPPTKLNVDHVGQPVPGRDACPTTVTDCIGFQEADLIAPAVWETSTGLALAVNGDRDGMGAWRYGVRETARTVEVTLRTIQIAFDPRAQMGFGGPATSDWLLEVKLATPLGDRVVIVNGIVVTRYQDA